MVLLNGEERHCIDVFDRGLQYGDGVFETIEIADGKPVFWQQHIQRLQQGCQRLRIPPPDSTMLRHEAGVVVTGADRAVLKLLVTRGVGGRGYRQPEQISPTRLVSLHTFPDYPQHFYQQGIVARFCQQRLSCNPVLAGIKHLNRLEQVLARAEWQDDGIQEGLMLDYDDRVIEGTMSNLFVCKSGVLYTPELNKCGIEGIVRRVVLDCAFQLGIPCRETIIDRHSLLDADELFVTNSVIGIWPIKQLEQSIWRVGELTQAIQRSFADARTVSVQL